MHKSKSMLGDPLRLVQRWMIGLVIGTLLIASSSPLFVRSYLPRSFDPIRQVWTLPQGKVYRWRSEGFANSFVGPMGMPGVRVELDGTDNSMPHLAFWGDSQAEGVGVSDDDKIFAISERLGSQSSRPWRVYPLARSGDDASDWIEQFPRVETALRIDAHVILVTELLDLDPAADFQSRADSQTDASKDVSRNQQQLSAWLPAFLLQAGRNLLFDDDKLRQLRFSLGPAKSPQPAVAVTSEAPVDPDSESDHWHNVCRGFRAHTELPVILLYAPQVPVIMSGKVYRDIDDERRYEALSQAASDTGLALVDLRREFIDSARQGAWPHGFHNGQIGVGHLNTIGNTIVAKTLLIWFQRGIRASS